MKKYRSKIVEIEAVQFNGNNWLEICQLPGCIGRETDSAEAVPSYLVVKTLEGDMKAHHGDWIIKGLEGEFYPCKDSVFQKKYEEIFTLNRIDLTPQHLKNEMKSKNE